jgi:hypothetical protein
MARTSDHEPGTTHAGNKNISLCLSCWENGVFAPACAPCQPSAGVLHCRFKKMHAYNGIHGQKVVFHSVKSRFYRFWGVSIGLRRGIPRLLEGQEDWS